MIEESETSDMGVTRDVSQDALAERRALRAEAGDPVVIRRAEAAEAAIRNLETHLTALEQRLEEVGSERERIAQQLVEREREVRSVKQREYAEQQLRVEAEDRAERAQREMRGQIQELNRRLDETERHARELSSELEAVRRELSEAHQAMALGERVRERGEELRERLLALEGRFAEMQREIGVEREAREQAERELFDLRERDARLAPIVGELMEVASELRLSFERELAELRDELQRQVIWERETYVRELTAMGARMEDLRFELTRTAADLRTQLSAEPDPGTLLHHTIQPESEREVAHRREMADALVTAVERLRARVAEVKEIEQAEQGDPSSEYPDVVWTPDVQAAVEYPQAPEPAPSLEFSHPSEPQGPEVHPVSADPVSVDPDPLVEEPSWEPADVAPVESGDAPAPPSFQALVEEPPILETWPAVEEPQSLEETGSVEQPPLMSESLAMGAWPAIEESSPVEDSPHVEEPAVASSETEGPAVTAAAYETPVVEAPPVDESPVIESPSFEPHVDDPQADEPRAEEPSALESPAPESPGFESLVFEPPVEESPTFQPLIEEPPAEEAVVAAEEAVSFASPLVNGQPELVPDRDLVQSGDFSPGAFETGEEFDDGSAAAEQVVVLQPQLLAVPEERTSWLAPAIRRLAEQRDAKLAAELVIELLPAQRQVVDGPVHYEIKINELGTFHVTLEAGRGTVSREGSSTKVDFLIEGSAAALSELAGGGVSRRQVGLRVRKGRRRARRLLKARRRPVALADLALAGIDMWPGLLLLAMAEAIDPAWTVGRRFELAFEIVDSTGIVIYVRISDGEPILVSRTTTGQPAATVSLTEHALMCLLAGAPSPPEHEALVSGDVTSVEMFLEWTARAQGLSTTST